MRPLQILPALSLAASCLTACAAEVGTPEEPDADVSAKAARSRTEYTRLASQLGLDDRLCPVLEPLARGGMPLTRMGMVAGFEGEVSGLGTMRAGTDVVFDFRNHQMEVSNYHGSGLAAEVGGSVSGYIGLAFGFQDSVTEWHGHFVTIPSDFGLPGVSVFLGASGALFMTGRDRNGDGHLHVADVSWRDGWPVIQSEDELLLPPRGIWGVTAAVEVGFEPEDVFGFDLGTGPLPDGVWIGLWEPAPDAIALQERRLSNNRLAWVGRPLEVRRVDPHRFDADGEHPDCAAYDPHCVLEFGRRGSSETWRGFQTANAICATLRGCSPLRVDGFSLLVKSLAATALAVGALQDFGGLVHELCPELPDEPMTPPQQVEPPPDFHRLPRTLRACLLCMHRASTPEAIAERCPSQCGGIDCGACLRHEGGMSCAPACVSDACTNCLDDGGGSGCIDRCTPSYLHARGELCQECIEREAPLGSASSCIPTCEVRKCTPDAEGIPICTP